MKGYQALGKGGVHVCARPGASPASRLLLPSTGQNTQGLQAFISLSKKPLFSQT